MLTLDAIKFDTTDLTLQGDQGNSRAWKSTAGDLVTLYVFQKPADFRAIPDDLERIRANSREQAARYGGAIVEVEIWQIAGMAAVREILKVPQKPTGMGYLGSFTLPFPNALALISVGAFEKGVTGMRDTAIFAKLMQSGEVKFGEDGAQPANWMRDPYDASIVGSPARNRAEDETYDAQFPDHPLSRLRALLRQIGTALQVSDETKGG